MNIILLAPLPPPIGGIANWTVSILSQSNAYNINIMVLNTAVEKRVTEGQSILDRSFVAGKKLLCIIHRLKKILRDECIDVVHITTSGGLGSIRSLMCQKYLNKKGIPNILHIHNGRYPDTYQSGGWKLKLLNRSIIKATQVITIDKSSLQLISKINKNTVYIPNPIDIKSITAVCNYRNIEKKKEVLFVGWVIKTKGIEELLKSWKELEDDFPGWILKIYGPSQESYLSYLQTNYSLRNVLFMGEVQHNAIIEAMAQSSIFVLPSYTEGSPNVVLEAMATGNAIIATKVGGIPDMLDDQSGILIDRECVDDISVNLRHLMCNPDVVCALRQSAYERVNQFFDISHIFCEYNNIWTNCVEM